MIVDLLVIGHLVDVAALGNGNDAVAGRCRDALQTGPSERVRVSLDAGISALALTISFPRHERGHDPRERSRPMSSFTRLSTNL
ncbi:MAG TPA: hypothetical protein VGL61_12765 [Kofleriaceae bacterium]